MTTHPTRPDVLTVARALAQLCAAGTTGTVRYTGTRLARELAAATGYPYTREEVDPAVRAACRVLTETYGVYADYVTEPGREGKGCRWRLSVQP
ncbi:hypothetical protein ABZV78_31135 [Micromonospora sp. NPDC004540]|uniref:hypothetical protein n=1 Tax=Micromonospora sp. NPDC004540 TaxID=3154457 RepID=UPI0033B53750